MQRRGRKRARRSSTRDDDEPSDEPVYCICRSSVCDTFMIACDACEEWYHGECINVTPKQAECIQKFYCQACRDEKPELQIEFKPDHMNGRHSYGSRHRPADISCSTMGDADDYADRFGSIQSRKRSSKHSQPLQPKSRRVPSAVPTRLGESSEDEFDLDHSQFASPSSSYSQSHIGPYSSRSKYGRVTLPTYENSNCVDFQQWRRPFSRNRSPQPCGECDSCKTRDNCGTCEVCRSPKFKQARSRQHCLLKGKMCLANDSDFQQPWRQQSSRGRYAPPCGECENCKTKGNCGTCEVCRSPKFKQGRSRQYCLYRAKICLGNGLQRQSSKISSQSHLPDPDYETHFDDFASSTRFSSGGRKGAPMIGSKMRRGDHLPGGGIGPSGRLAHDPQFPRRGPHSDLNLLDSSDFVDAYSISPTHRTDRNGSSRFVGPNSRQNDLDSRVMRNVGGIMDTDDLLAPADAPPNYDSDEDVVLPEMRPCAGPACSKPAIRSRYCSEECQLRHESDSINRMHTSSRCSSVKDQIKTPYALPYPDHLYCRHHRMYSSQVYNVDTSLGAQQSGSSVSDMYSDVYTTFVSSNQSAVMDYAYDPMAGSSQMPTGYRRLSAAQGNGPDDYFATYPQGNHVSKVGSGGHSRKFPSLEDMRGRGLQSTHLVGSRMLPLTGRRQVHSSLGTVVGGSGSSGSGDVLSPVPLESITPTMQSIRMYNGHLGGGPPDYRVNSGDGESAAAAELLTADANDLIDVDGTSSSGVGGGSMNAVASAGAPTFRQGDEYYMMNENENIEINWPTSPGGVATASAGTV
ncbi:unnamed protein product [Hydatigera taeniaeformis]|uniref:PHD-type domain-containing protein n=1 Tax=Hydatigena taeniaeformis TaxID=6205 RepID=A0A3P7EG80_HYDTA|nr:unnamed protein product [Hydatigera taeniaeformis]